MAQVNRQKEVGQLVIYDYNNLRLSNQHLNDRQIEELIAHEIKNERFQPFATRDQTYYVDMRFLPHVPVFEIATDMKEIVIGLAEPNPNFFYLTVWLIQRQWPDLSSVGIQAEYGRFFFHLTTKSENDNLLYFTTNEWFKTGRRQRLELYLTTNHQNPTFDQIIQFIIDQIRTLPGLNQTLSSEENSIDCLDSILQAVQL